MDIAKIIGTVVSTSKVPSLEGSTICVIQPLNEKLENAGQPLIATDATSRHGVGEIVYYVASGDATFTGLRGEELPSDAAVIGIVDSIHTIPG